MIVVWIILPSFFEKSIVVENQKQIMIKYYYLLPVKAASDLLHINNIIKRKTQTLTTLLLIRKLKN